MLFVSCYLLIGLLLTWAFYSAHRSEEHKTGRPFDRNLSPELTAKVLLPILLLAWPAMLVFAFDGIIRKLGGWRKTLRFIKAIFRTPKHYRISLRYRPARIRWSWRTRYRRYRRPS